MRSLQTILSEQAGGGARVMRRMRRGTTSFSADATDEISMVLNLSETHSVSRRMAGRTSGTRPRVGAVTLLPPGCPAHYTIDGAARVVMVRLPWAAMLGWLAEDQQVDPASVEIQPLLHVDDPVLARLLYGVSSDTDDAAEAGLRFVATRLFTRHAARPPAKPVVPVRGGLAPGRLRRVLDMVEDDLAGALTLGRLAAEAGMSPFHFAREFERSTGHPPHQHLIRRRVDRAIVLLTSRRLTVAAVAEQVGFAHASHLARHMKRWTGLTPQAFRSLVLP